MENDSIKTNQLQYVTQKLNAQKKEILSFKQLIRRLRQSKLKMKYRIKQLQRENVKQAEQKKLLHISFSIAKKISKSNIRCKGQNDENKTT